MTLSLVTGPSVEPLDLADAKLHLRVDGTDEDSLIEGLIAAARLSVEANLGLALINQTWKWSPENTGKTGDGSHCKIPLGPVSAIVSVSVAGQTLPPSEYSFVPGLRASVTFNSALQNSEIHIIFVAGFGMSASDVPRDLRHAVAMLVAHWFENREPGGVGDVGLPGSISTLLSSYRKVRL